MYLFQTIKTKDYSKMELDLEEYAKLPPKIQQNISKCFDSKLLRPKFKDRNGSVLISIDRQIVMIRITIARIALRKRI